MTLASVISFFTFSRILTIVYFINFLIALGIIFLDNKSPVATMAWVMILFVIPIVGLVFYIVFSQNIARMKIYKWGETDEYITNEIRQFIFEKMDTEDNDFFNPIVYKWKELAAFNMNYADALISENDKIALIADGKEWMDRVIKDIEAAEKCVNVNFFIIKDDYVGQRLINVLTEKARQGVEVRLLMDALGSKSITNRKLREFKEAGGKYAFFFKPFIRHLFIRINYRNHRKIVVIDDKIAYTGGFNVAREYLGDKKKFGYWRDSAIRIEGVAVATLNTVFYLDWNYASKDDHSLIDDIYYKDVYYEKFTGIPVQIVSCGPNSPKEEIKLAMMKMISNAKNKINIQTPYFVPDEAIIQALILAANSGVEVNVMIPCMPDHPFVYRTTLHNAGILLNNGVNVYIYENGFLHAKTLVVDSEVATIGSCNFDIRSFRLNFETNAVIYDEGFAETMDRQFEEDIKLSRRYTLEDRKNLPVTSRMAESISRLLTEIL